MPDLKRWGIPPSEKKMAGTVARFRRFSQADPHSDGVGLGFWPNIGGMYAAYPGFPGGKKSNQVPRQCLIGSWNEEEANEGIKAVRGMTSTFWRVFSCGENVCFDSFRHVLTWLDCILLL